VKKTIGIVAVAALAARAALLAIAKITTTCCRTWLGQTDEHVRRGELFDEPLKCPILASGSGRPALYLTGAGRFSLDNWLRNR
jgi:hypothetical protein